MDKKKFMSWCMKAKAEQEKPTPHSNYECNLAYEKYKNDSAGQTEFSFGKDGIKIKGYGLFWRWVGMILLLIILLIIFILS
jgi:hypothetical protein